MDIYFSRASCSEEIVFSFAAFCPNSSLAILVKIACGCFTLIQFTMTTLIDLRSSVELLRMCERQAVLPVPGAPEIYSDPGFLLERWEVIYAVKVASCSSRQSMVEGRLPWRDFFTAAVPSKSNFLLTPAQIRTQ